MSSFQKSSSSTPTVAHLVIELENGGLEHLVMRWTAYRNEKAPGSTHIICLDKPGFLAEQFEGGAVHCVKANRSQFPWDRGAVERLAELLSQLNIDVIHSHNSTAQQYAVLAARKSGIPHLQTQHGMDVHGRGLKGYIRNRIMSFFTPQYAAVSAEVVQNICKNHGVPANRVHFVANGVEEHPIATSQALEQLRDTLKIPESSFVLGSVGRLTTVKGWDLFLPVFAKLIEKKPIEQPLHLLLVGDGAERSNLQKMSQELGIENNVSFAGFQRNCHPYYDLIDLFTMPSRSEGLSVSLLEAMQAGCPVAVTAVGEHTKLVEASSGGIVLTPEKPESWLDTLINFIRNTDQLQQCAAKGKAHIESNYTLENTCQSYESLYQLLLT